MDTPPSLESQLRAYLSYQMSPDERAAFEVLLRKDQATRDAYLRFSMQGEGTDILAQTEQLRQHARAFRERIGPLPAPHITWLDRLRIAWYAHPWRTGLFALLISFFCTVLGLFIWVNLGGGIRAVDDVAAGRFIVPPCVEVMATTRVPKPAKSQRWVFEKAAGFYCDTSLYYPGDSLQALAAQYPPFSFADYYFAHWLFKNREWTSARAALQQCLQPENISYIQGLEETHDIEPLRLNLLLARLGEANLYDDHIREDLAALLAALPPEHPVYKVAIAVRRELESPLRRFKIL